MGMGTAGLANDQSMDERDRPRIGLVLSGGGAKGFAHIGTLKLLDSLQIPVDYIVGTSMGGIVGALYAIGYSGIEIEELAIRQNWTEMFNDQPPRQELPFFEKELTGRYQLEFGFEGTKPVTPSGLIYGQKILLKFASLTFAYEHVKDFDKLPIPFRCVAVDLIGGNEVVLGEGSLAKAMRATMAIPTVFSPVQWGDSLLVDGGLLNNLPVDIALELGADIVIAVDVGGHLQERQKLGSALSVFEQSIAVVGMEKLRRHAERADIYIRPDLDGFTAADFQEDRVTQICDRGNRAAKSMLDSIIELKEKYNLRRVDNPVDLTHFAGTQKVYDVQVVSQSSIQPEFLRYLLDIKSDDIFQPAIIQQKLSELRARGFTGNIRYEAIPMSDSYVRLVFRIDDQIRPIINGISILNNRHLPFQFIYTLIGYKPGDRLDTEVLNGRIMAMYGLGYFETVHYEIQPIRENEIHLTIIVNELPLRRLRIGVRYDDRHRLVAAVAGQANNVLIPGLRIESELQFAGLTRFRYKMLYPSRALNLPAYPYARVAYMDIPTSIFDGDGNRIAEYRDRSFIVGAGMGILLFKAFNTEIEYHHEYVRSRPGVAVPDPELFPNWYDDLRTVRATVKFDMIDNVLLPRNGVLMKAQYDRSSKNLGSELDFTVIGGSIDGYQTFGRRHTVRLYGLYGTGWGTVPIYKYFNKSTPAYLIGLRYDQLRAHTIGIARFEYRYEHKRDIFFKVMVNRTFDSRFLLNDVTYRFNDLWGAGAGVLFLSPVGPLEFMVGYGDKHILGEREYQVLTYFVLGYKF
jgi:predicted acylesterase/phospholipase RssA